MAVKTKACLMRLLLELGVEADLEKCLDAYALQYISEVLSQVHDEDGSFDLECFVSMLAAYIPELESADRSKMMDWTVYAAAELSGQDPPMADGSDTDVTAGMCALQGVSQLEQVCVGGRQQEVLEEDTGKVLPVEQPRQAELSEDERLLQEMFPDVLANEIHDVFVAMDMDMDRTVESLLSDTHQNVRQVEESSCKESVGSSTEMADKGCAVVDQAVKDSILAKYSYIDTQSDKTTHRPFLPQNSAENKKIRYRDDRVVSTKGERFSVVTKKDLESEDMKKTYINLKPLRHYRFH